MYIKEYIVYFKGGETHKTYAQSAKEACQRTRKVFPGKEIVGYETTPDHGKAKS